MLVQQLKHFGLPGALCSASLLRFLLISLIGSQQNKNLSEFRGHDKIDGYTYIKLTYKCKDLRSSLVK